MAKNFIGYADLLEWRKAIDPRQPVYASPVIQPGSVSKQGLRVDRAEIHVAQPDEWGDVHYWQFTVGRWQELSHAPDFGARDREKVITRRDEIWSLIKVWLDEQGLVVRDALIAFPRNLRLLEGTPGILRWNQERSAWERTDRGEA